MNTHAFFTSLLKTASFMVLVFQIPDPATGQRLNHPNFSPRPATPAPARPVPSPAPSRPAEPVAIPRPTINGGSHNYGNHDYNRGPERGPENIHQEAPVHGEVHESPSNTRQPSGARPPAGSYPRDHVNIYHTGGYRGFHPYYYHPYRPYYWGPHWHPVGFFLPYLTAAAIRISFGGNWYYYDDGVYYVPFNGGYSVVLPPVGAVVSFLPDGYETLMVGNDTYYYFGGVFYVYVGQGYQVVNAPPGAVVYELPTGAAEQRVNGQILLFFNNTYFQPILMDGQDAYEVIQVS